MKYTERCLIIMFSARVLTLKLILMLNTELVLCIKTAEDKLCSHILMFGELLLEHFV